MTVLPWMVVLAALPAPADSLVERLGHEPGARLLILHGDDLGMCRAANAAAREAYGNSMMNSGSAMVPCPWFGELAAWWDEQEAPPDLGLHLTLTSEWRHYRWGPVLPVEDVPSLVDADGFLWRDVSEVTANASVAEVKAEIRAQIARARRFGLEPTHVDSHMGTLFARPDYFLAYVEVAAEEGIVPFIPRIDGVLREQLEELGILGAARIMMAGIEARGFPLIDTLYSTEGRTYEERKAHLLGIVRDLRPGVTQVILHPSAAGDELSHITNSHRARSDDLRLMSDPDLATAIREEGIVLVTWREISRVWRADAPLVMAHRGARALEDENTLAAFELAVGLGVDFVECDPRVTADGEFVLMHDETVDRTTDGTGRVADMSLEAVRGLRTQGGHRVPTLRELLHFAAGRRLGVYLDIKEPSLATVQALLDLVDEARMARRVVLGVWRADLARWVKEHRPRVATMVSWPLPAANFEVAAEMGARWVGIPTAQATRTILDLAHEAGLKVVTLPLNDRDLLAEKAAAGLDVLQTDDPRLAEGLR
ncbi:MAG: ChbG/HpnK family deacetylase [Planctomycetota bacterium]|nr:ChbG/HpnK family deacetylase [Planctomycetota bacterium]MDP6990864.1 ChbG/HpnK family deacetylase [Planctomycetota bacterium]